MERVEIKVVPQEFHLLRQGHLCYSGEMGKGCHSASAQDGHEFLCYKWTDSECEKILKFRPRLIVHVRGAGCLSVSVVSERNASASGGVLVCLVMMRTAGWRIDLWPTSRQIHSTRACQQIIETNHLNGRRSPSDNPRRIITVIV